MLSDADALFVEEDYEGAVAAYSDVSACRRLQFTLIPVTDRPQSHTVARA